MAFTLDPPFSAHAMHPAQRCPGGAVGHLPCGRHVLEPGAGARGRGRAETSPDLSDLTWSLPFSDFSLDLLLVPVSESVLALALDLDRLPRRHAPGRGGHSRIADLALRAWIASRSSPGHDRRGAVSPWRIADRALGGGVNAVPYIEKVPTL